MYSDVFYLTNQLVTQETTAVPEYQLALKVADILKRSLLCVLTQLKLEKKKPATSWPGSLLPDLLHRSQESAESVTAPPVYGGLNPAHNAGKPAGASRLCQRFKTAGAVKRR